MACCCELQNTLDVEVTQEALLDVEIGGSAGVLLQAKSVEVTANGTSVVAPDDGFDGLKIVEINTNVPKRFECGDAYFLPITSAQKNLSLISRLQKVDISCWDVSSYTNMNSMFEGCTNLTTVPALDASNVTREDAFVGAFANCTNLKSILMTNISTDLTIAYSTQFEREDLLVILNNLKTVTSATSLTMGKTNLAKLTEEDKAIATNKG